MRNNLESPFIVDNLSDDAITLISELVRPQLNYLKKADTANALLLFPINDCASTLPSGTANAIRSIFYSKSRKIDSAVTATDLVAAFDDSVWMFVNKNELFENKRLAVYALCQIVIREPSSIAPYVSVENMCSVCSDAIFSLYEDEIFSIIPMACLPFFHRKRNVPRYIEVTVPVSKIFNNVCIPICENDSFFVSRIVMSRICMKKNTSDYSLITQNKNIIKIRDNLIAKRIDILAAYTLTKVEISQLMNFVNGIDKKYDVQDVLDFLTFFGNDAKCYALIEKDTNIIQSVIFAELRLSIGEIEIKAIFGNHNVSLCFINLFTNRLMGTVSPTYKSIVHIKLDKFAVFNSWGYELSAVQYVMPLDYKKLSVLKIMEL